MSGRPLAGSHGRYKQCIVFLGHPVEERWDSHVGQKTLLFRSFWIESLHLHCKGGEDEETERKESNGLLGVVKMRRGVEKIAMGVSKFVEHRSGKSIAIDRYQNV